MRERNSLLASLARSASSRASRTAASARLRSVMSVEMPPSAYGRPSESSSGNFTESQLPSSIPVAGSSTSRARTFA